MATSAGTLRRFAIAAALVLVASAAVFAIARSDTTGSWMGQVAYLNNRHIGVKAQAQTRDFVIDDSTQVYVNDKQSTMASVSKGATVTVAYAESSLFGSTHATRITVMSFTLPTPSSAPATP